MKKIPFFQGKNDLEAYLEWERKVYVKIWKKKMQNDRLSSQYKR